MALRATKVDENAFWPRTRAAAPFPGNLDTEPPCVSKRVFRRPCNPGHLHRTATVKDRTFLPASSMGWPSA